MWLRTMTAWLKCLVLDGDIEFENHVQEMQHLSVGKSTLYLLRHSTWQYYQP